MPRAVKNHREEPAVDVGDHDPLTASAKQLGLPRCLKRDSNTIVDVPVNCTRPAGHDEDPHAKHVYAPRFIALHIWEDAP